MKHKSDIVMYVEMLPGTSIENAVEQAKELVIKLDIAYIDFSFNGVNVSVGKKAFVESAGDALNDCFENKKKFCILN